MSEVRQAYRFVYEAMLHANHLLYAMLPADDPMKLPIHKAMDQALKACEDAAREWGEDVRWMLSPPVGVGETGSE